MSQHGIQLWPGYITSVGQKEHELLLNVEIGYKFLRLESVYDLFRKFENDRNRMSANCIQQIIITDYNNMTYRVDSIDFTKNPQSTFMKGTTEISYMDYYRKRYNITIRDPKQPLIVSKANARQLRGGAPEEYYLIPELCRLTGMTDQMRDDKFLMRDLAQYTRVDPRGRQQRLNDFARRMTGSQSSVASLKEFGLELSPNLVKFKGRVLDPEQIKFFDNKSFLAAKADWTGAMQKEAVFSTGAADPLNNWFILTPSRVINETTNFLDLLKKVSTQMKIPLGKPKV